MVASCHQAVLYELQSTLSGSRWACALATALWNGREFKAYAFGAFVLYTHPKESLFHCAKAVKDKRVTRKWRNRLVPAIYVEVSVGPGCQWVQACQVVSLAFLLPDNRASRVSIRTVADVIFPEVVSFPLRQRLTLNGAFEDTTLPAPHVIDAREDCGVLVDADTEE